MSEAIRCKSMRKRPSCQSWVDLRSALSQVIQHALCRIAELNSVGVVVRLGRERLGPDRAAGAGSRTGEGARGNRGEAHAGLIGRYNQSTMSTRSDLV